MMTVSLIDSVPAEIAVATLKNLRSAMRRDGLGDTIINTKVSFVQVRHCEERSDELGVQSLWVSLHAIRYLQH